MGDFSLKIYPTKAVKISLPAQGRNFSDKKVIAGNKNNFFMYANKKLQKEKFHIRVI